MSLAADEQAFLDYVADDWYGLWEVDWWLNNVHPGWSFASRLAFLSDLVQRGLVEIFFGQLGVESPALKKSAALDAISQPTAWLPRTETNDSVHCISTSLNGRAELAGSVILQ
ncbi:hypothetical protein SKP52_02280 [Sphingopyxis fribergensis]|uniref:Uncharacterized protein n=1 Tax=Sphingopyxis fribergensis TaxID=1515612 RepID=A0A0A7PHH2_9SPHN|nr:hypothetical protein [Sphingopyxis fribergensis]AJA07392.1 hypothetical protein SKP52_02280 [Sphingopyxis fribergensis]